MDQNLITDFIMNIRIESNRAYLPSWQMDRKVYEKHIKKPLDNLGGKWDPSLKCYDFPFDPTDRIRDLAEGKKVKLSTKYQYFDTPIEMVGHMFMFSQEAGLDWTKMDMKTAKVLEPGAGRGNILKVTHLQGYKNLYYYELMPENREVLQKEITRLKIPAVYLGEDFFERKETGFDLVISNPPFRNDRKHIGEMFQIVKDHGIVLTLGSMDLYSDEKFHQYLNSVSDCWEMIEKRSDPEDPLFEGTLTGCTMIAARKRMPRPNGGSPRKQLDLF